MTIRPEHQKTFPSSRIPDTLLMFIRLRGGANAAVNAACTYAPLADFYELSEDARRLSTAHYYAEATTPGLAWNSEVNIAAKSLKKDGYLSVGARPGKSSWRLTPSGVERADFWLKRMTDKSAALSSLRADPSLVSLDPEDEPLVAGTQQPKQEPPKKTSLRRLQTQALFFAVSLLSTFLVPDAAFSQSAGALPPNAHARPYGTGWQCDFGYRQADLSCAVIQAPANAHIVEFSFGRGWDCDRGYREAGGACAKVAVPENAYSTDSSNGRRGWECARGYRAANESCAAVKLPVNAYLSDTAYGAGWECDRGYRVAGESCLIITVPENAHLQGAGNRWRCDRGFRQIDNSCAHIAIPENAYLDPSGESWRCERGYQRLEASCTTLNVPANAHIANYGDRWECNQPYRRQGDGCVRF